MASTKLHGNQLSSFSLIVKINQKNPELNFSCFSTPQKTVVRDILIRDITVLEFN